MTTHVPRGPYSDTELQSLYPPSLQLQQVQILLRHGERTPVKTRFANAGVPVYWPYCSVMRQMRSAMLNPQKGSVSTMEWRRQLETFGKDDTITAAAGAGGELDALCDLGMLTDRGRETTLQLGTRFRKLYIDQLGFLPATMDSNDLLYLRATPIPRALESLQQAFQGLYPIQTRAPQLPLPTIYSRSFDNETLFPNETACRRFGMLAREFAQRAADTWNDSNDIKYLNEKLGKWMPANSPTIAVDSKPRLVGIIDSINSTAAHGPQTRLPKEFYDPKVKAIGEKIVVDEWFTGYKESQEYRTLGIGSLMGDIVERMVRSVDPLPKTTTRPFRMSLSGCHDTTMAAIVASLGAYNTEAWPPFTSHVAIELFREAGKPPAASASSWVPSYFAGKTGTIGRKHTPSLSEAEKSKLKGHYVRVRYNDEPITIPGCKPAGKHLEGDETFCTLVSSSSTMKKHDRECTTNKVTRKHLNPL